MRHLSVLVMTLILLFALGTYANATLILSLDDGAGNAITVADESADDAWAGVGTVLWAGVLGVWNVNVSTGDSEAGTAPNMDLNSINESSAAGTMTIRLTDDFPIVDAGITGFTLAAGGTFTGTTTFNYYVDNVLVASAQTDAYAWSDLFGFDYTDTPPSQFMIEAIISHDEAGRTSFDTEMKPVPEPGTLLLLGSGLIGLAFLKRRKS